MNPDKTETSIFIDAETTEMLLSQIAHKELVRKKLKEFWDTNGEIIVNQYKDLLLPPEHINISKDAFDEKIITTGRAGGLLCPPGACYWPSL